MAERVTKRPRQAARSAERSPGDRNDINEPNSVEIGG
jgi:hypothetical protein